MGSRSLVAFLGIGGLLCGLAWWLSMPGALGEPATQPRAAEVRAEIPVADPLDAASPSSAVEASNRQSISVDTIAALPLSSSRFSHPEWEPFTRPLKGRILAAPRPEFSETEPRPLPDFEVDFLVARAREAKTPFQSLKTDSEGRFTLDLRPLVERMSSIAEARIAGWELWPRDPARTLGGSSLDLTAWLSQPPEPVDFILGELGVFELSGQVLDEVGAPFPEGAVSYIWGEQEKEVPTDDRGRFHLVTSIPVDRNHRLQHSESDSIRLLVFDNIGPRHLEDIRIHAWQESHVKLGNFRLAKRKLGESWVKGRVHSVDGTPLPHWPLGIGRGSGFAKRTDLFFADGEGYFSIVAPSEQVAYVRLTQSEEHVHGGSIPPESNLVLQSKEPTVILSCVDPWGDPVSLHRYTSIRSTTPGPDPVEGRAIEHDGRLFATVPMPGEYEVKKLWMGLYGDWQIDQRFEVVPGHQEIVLHAEYVPRPTPAPDNGTSGGPSTPRIR